MKQFYTDKQYKELLTHLIVLAQTNEQVNDHILDEFDRNGIRYRQRSIGEGDYCFLIEACPSLGFPVDTYFTDELFIERKNSLQELASSIYGHKTKRSSGVTEYDDAFRRELKRAILKPYKFLLVEQPGGWSDIRDKKYPNDYSPEAFESTLTKIELEYGLHVRFVRREDMARHIYKICRFVLDRYIMKG